jgi:hypothetical protein
MGNAFVAVVDDKDALYYNPAGLNRIKTVHAQVNLFGSDGYRPYARDGWGLHERPPEEPAPFDPSDTTIRDLAPSPEEPPRIGAFQGAEFAMHNFGLAYWGDVRVRFIPSSGLIFSYPLEERQTDVVFQIAGARDFFDQRLSVGAGYSLANRRQRSGPIGFDYNTSTPIQDSGNPRDINDTGYTAKPNTSWDYGDYTSSNLRATAQDKLNEAMVHPRRFDAYGHGIDLGILWRQTSWLRLGGAARNLGMFLDGDAVTPDLTVGLAITPGFLSAGGTWSRTVNFALDYQDFLSSDNHYKALSKVNFGAEIEQNFTRFLGARLGGGSKGGYWTAGGAVSVMSLVELELVSWAEEAGTFTGDVEERHYAFNVAVCF